MILKIRTILKFIINPYFTFKRKFSQSVLIPDYKEPIDLNIKYYISKKKEFSYICPLCKGSGIIPCKFCKQGCLYCGYSSYILCRCHLHALKI